MKIERYKKFIIPGLILLIMLLSIFFRLDGFDYEYLRNVDSYFFERQINLILEYGILPEEDSVGALAPKIVAPEEMFSSPFKFDEAYSYVYVYLGAFLFIASKLFNPLITLFDFLVIYPTIVMAFAAIPVYYLVKRIFDRRAGVLAAFFYLFDVQIFSRTLGGNPDSDPIILLLTVLLVATFLYGYQAMKNYDAFSKQSIKYIILISVIILIYKLSWIGYWYSVWILMGFVVGKFLLDIYHDKFDFKKSVEKNIEPFKGLLAILGLSTILIFIFVNNPIFPIDNNFLGDVFLGPLEFNALKESEIYPNVFISISELQTGNLGAIIERLIISDSFAFILSPFMTTIYILIYLFYTALSRKNTEAFILLSIWFLGALIATLTAVRFTIIMAAPISICAAIFWSKIFSLASRFKK